MHIADNIRAGMTPDGGAPAGADRARRHGADSRAIPRSITFRWVDALLKDIQFGFRTMRRSAGFTMLAIVTLAVGIAATNTAFTIMNAVMIRELPFDEAHRLVDVGFVEPSMAIRVCHTRTLGIGREPQMFVGMSASQTGTMNVSRRQPRSRAVPWQLRERIDLQASPRPTRARPRSYAGDDRQARRRSPF